MNARARAEAETIIARYPDKRAAMLPVLWLMEREHGVIDAAVEEEVGALLGCSPAQVREVTTFYTMFRRPGMGRNVIQVCHTLPCALNGASAVVKRLRERLGIAPGESTPDGAFHLMKVECLAACDHAPCLQVNDRTYHRVTLEQVDRILEEWKSR